MAELHVPHLIPVDRPVSRLTTSMCVAVAAIAVLNLADLLSTYAVLRHPGAIEGNPLSALLLTNGWVAVFKAAVLVGLIIRIPRRRPTVGVHALLWFVAGFYGLTVLSNLLILQRLG